MACPKRMEAIGTMQARHISQGLTFKAPTEKEPRRLTAGSVVPGKLKGKDQIREHTGYIGDIA